MKTTDLPCCLSAVTAFNPGLDNTDEVLIVPNPYSVGSRLNVMNYTGYPDGIFGQYLEAAVRKFQKDNKLWVSGTIYKKNYNLIVQKVSELSLNSK